MPWTTYFLSNTFLTNAFPQTFSSIPAFRNCLTDQNNIDVPQVVTYRHIVVLAVRVVLHIQVGEVEEHPVGGVHADDPGAVHAVGVVGGVGGGVDLPVRRRHRTPTSWRLHGRREGKKSVTRYTTLWYNNRAVLISGDDGKLGLHFPLTCNYYYCNVLYCVIINLTTRYNLNMQ